MTYFLCAIILLASWRQDLKRIHPIRDKSFYVYEFGVHTGKSMIELRKLLKPTKMFGFDSFRGLPETRKTNIHDWKLGHYASDNRKKLSVYPEFQFVSGWYNESLNDSIVDQLKMRKASYIDIDCDLYESAFEALDFVFRNKIAVPGTLIGYDDIWVIPCTNESFHPLSVGEGLAHLQIAQKFNVEFECVNAACSDVPSGWGTIFRVKSIGKRIQSDWKPTRNCYETLQYEYLIKSLTKRFQIVDK